MATSLGAFAIFLTAGTLPGLAQGPDLSRICDQAATVAAQRTGVPLSVLKAISRTETGRSIGGSVQPWPWTVNMEGQGKWFDSEAVARAFAVENFNRGARSFDIGCFQINYRWHHQAFSSIAEMFDPVENALYAARFLSDLYAEKGNWDDAAGAYHSRTPEFANRYKARFARYRAQFLAEDPIPLRAAQLSDEIPRTHSEPDITPHPDAVAATRDAPVRVNSYPLLHAGSGSVTSIGSLVPLNTAPTARGLFVTGEAG